MWIFSGTAQLYFNTALTQKYTNEITIFFPATDDLKALFARSKEGSIRTIKVDIQDGML